jgi:glycerate kinase
MRVLIAPQEFKGSLAADEAAAAIAAGIRRVRREWVLDVLPLSDGGPGLLDAMRRAVKADTLAVVAHDALGRRVLARYLRTRASGDIIVEAAQANGLLHIGPEERDALRADSFGVGEIIVDAARERPRRMIIGVGGSATTDGGAGAARAMGARFRDMAGRELPPGGAALANLERISWERPAWAAGIEFVVACDVTNPLCGPNGAARVYGPQKGAAPDEVELLDEALYRYAMVVRRHFGIDLADMPGAGAAGGLAGGLVAFLGARLASGFDLVAEATGLRERLAPADVVVTGEGRFDAQSVQGKVTGRLMELATSEGKPVVVFAGQAAEGATARTIFSIEPDEQRAMERAAEHLAELAARWAGETAEPYPPAS